MKATDEFNLAEQLRAAVRAAGLTTYALARDAGIDRAVAVRFMNGERGLNLDSASKVCRLLGLQLRPVRRRSKKGR